MSAALAPPEVAPAAAPALSRPSRPTLERRLDSILTEARARGHAECPVCGAAMVTREAARELRCGGCGSRLS
jgi:ribosomal protein L37AE/L43A